MASITVTVEIHDVEVDVEVTFNPGWYTPAKLSGHPDSWTPAEGECAEIESIILTLESGRKVNLTDRLSTKAKERVQRACDAWEYPEPDYEPDPDYYDEAD